MATAQKPDRRSLVRRDQSLAARAGTGVSTALDAVTSGGIAGRVDAPSKEFLNKLLLTLGIRALVTGIALTLISPTVPVFVGANLLFGVPVAVRYLYRRRTDARNRGLGGGRATGSSRATGVGRTTWFGRGSGSGRRSRSGRLSRVARALSELSLSRDSNRL